MISMGFMISVVKSGRLSDPAFVIDQRQRDRLPFFCHSVSPSASSGPENK